MDLRERHLARALPLDGLDDIRSLKACLIRGAAGNDRDYRGIAETLGNRGSDFASCFRPVRLVYLVLPRGEVAGVSVERLEQPVQSAVGHEGDVGLFHVFTAN